MDKLPKEVGAMVTRIFNDAAFRQTLQDAGFYKDWRARHGEESWKFLEGAVGSLN